MNKILFILLVIAVAWIPAPVLADDATPPPPLYEPVGPNVTVEDLCASIGGCTPIETPPPNQEDIPCGEKFSLCVTEEMENELPGHEKPPNVSEPPTPIPMEFHHFSGCRVR